MGENRVSEPNAVQPAPAPEHAAAGDREQMPSPKSTKAPAFQFYPRDFLMSPKVRNMKMAERGVYITLLSLCWLDGSLPTTMSELATECRMPTSQFKRLWEHSVVAMCFYEKDGRLYNERLDRERSKQLVYLRRQSDNGSKGGRPKKNPHETQKEPAGFTDVTQSEARALQTEDRKAQILVSREGGSGETEFHGDEAIRKLQEAYPQNRVTYGPLTEEAFIHQLGAKSGDHAEVFATMLAHLENHKRSHEWRIKGMVPRLYKWLSEGLWRNTMDEDAPVGERLTSKTQRTADAIGRIVKESA